MRAGVGKDTMLGYLRRIGPAQVELLDKDTGISRVLDLDAFADAGLLGDESGQEWTDRLFGEEAGKG